jgi:hypothetical protein
VANFTRKLRERNRLKFSAMGKASQRVQAARRLSSVTPEYLAELASAMPFGKGDPTGAIEIRNFLTGRVLRWTKLRGDRVNQHRLRSPDGRVSKSVSATRIMDRLRKVLAG